MQRLEVSGAVHRLQWSLGVKGLNTTIEDLLSPNTSSKMDTQ